LNQIPSVVLAPDLVPSAPPVIERQSDTPNHAEDQHIVNLLRAQSITSRPVRVMRMIQCWQNRPHAVHLRPVPVDFGEDEEDGEEGEGEGEAGYYRVGGGVYALQCLCVADVLEDGVWEGVELRQVGLHDA